MGTPANIYHPIASAFPYVHDLSIFKNQVGDKEEIRYMEQSNGYTVGCYLISAESTWDNPYAIECRGLVFDKQGKLVSRPLHKFFNLNEKDGSRPADFDWSKLIRIMDKRDGSMIHTVRVLPHMSPFSSPEIRDGMPIEQDTMSWGARASGFALKSKKSFESDVAVSATNWMATRENYINFCDQLAAQDTTAIFEWTSPTARIVLPYQEDMLTLLHIRDNATGNYCKPDLLEAVARRFGIPTVKSHTVNEEQRHMFEQAMGVIVDNKDPQVVLNTVLKLQETITDIEGWVFQFEDGQMVKVKTKWYMERHKAMTNLRERDIVKMVLLESIDDLKAMLVGEGVNIAEIVQLEEFTVNEIRRIEHAVEKMHARTLATHDAPVTKKDAALMWGPSGVGHPYFGLLMNKMDGKEPDAKAWYERHVLPTVPLRQLNLTQTVAEVE